MSDFPRGWTLSNDAPAGTAAITVPAISGVVHVLDAIDAKAVAGATALGGVVWLSSSDGTFSHFVLGRYAADANANDQITRSGLDLAAGPGASLTITFSSGSPGGAETLVIQGHDI